MVPVCFPQALVPVTIEVEVPFELHRYIIGQKGSGIRKMMDEFEVSVDRFPLCWVNVRPFAMTLVLLQVNIQVPAPEQQSDKIAITGLANHLDRAKEGLLERVKELQAEQEDRVSVFFFSPPVAVIFEIIPKASFAITPNEERV